MRQKPLLSCLILVLLGLSAASQSKAQFDMPLAEAWEAYKQRFIFCGQSCGNDLGLVFDPSQGYQATSESSGYGMLIAVMMNDQATFDIIYDATYRHLSQQSTGLFHWRINNAGEITGGGSATDADLDIAAALIFAHRRTMNGTWAPHNDRPYGSAADVLIDSIYEYEVVDGAYLKPGDQFGGAGREIINLSYFAPAWMQLFDNFQGTNRWQPVIDQGYASLYATPGAEFGLAPDWSTADGQPASAYCEREGSPVTGCSFEMGYDAIRVPWRQAVHCIWNGDTRACDWSQRSVDFLNQLPRSASQARFFDMSGSPTIGYQDTVMRSMWATAALAAGDTNLLSSLVDSVTWTPSTSAQPGYWGERPEDYYHQSLAWFMASLVAGEFRPIE